MLSHYVLMAAQFASAVLAGMFIGVSMVEHAMRTLPAPDWIAYKQAKERVFGRAMPRIFGAILLLCLATAATWRELETVIAAVLLLIVLAITVVVHLPLNRRFQDWGSTSYPVNWDADRRRWRDWNMLRALLVVGACLLISKSTFALPGLTN